MEGASNAAPAVTSEASGSAVESQASEAGSQAQEGKASQANGQAQGGGDELEEIAIGRVKGKLPKELAKAVKDLERGFHQKSQEAAGIKKQFQSFAQAAKENPDLFFEQFGIDPDNYSESRLARKLEQMAMSPEQRKLMEAEARLKQYEEQEKRAKEEQEREETSKKEQAELAQLDKDITEAFVESGLPKHPHYVQQIAATLLAAEKQGVDLSPRQAAAKVKARFESHTRELLDSLDLDGIRRVVSDKVQKMLREAELEKVTRNTAPTPNTASRTGSPVSKAKSQPKKALDERGFRSYLESLKS